MKARIDIIGDPLLDYWNDGTESRYEFGGALNVYENLSILTNKLEIDINPVFELPDYNIQNELKSNFFANYPCKQYLLENNEIVLSESFYGHPLKCSKLLFNNNFKKADDRVIVSTLVVSDYNKGFVNENLQTLFEQIYSYDIIIVDSRYGTTNLDLLRKHTDILILRRTKGIDKMVDFPYNYIIETDGPGVVRITDCELELTTEHIGPIYSAQSTCGAGDVFTSGLAVSLTDIFRSMSSSNNDFQEFIDGSITDYILNESVEAAFNISQEAVSRSTFTCKVPLN